MNDFIRGLFVVSTANNDTSFYIFTFPKKKKASIFLLKINFLKIMNNFKLQE